MTNHDHSGFRRIPGISREMRAGFAKAPRSIELRGVVRTGVERGSVVLLDPNGGLLAQLMGVDPAVIGDGVAVRVTGYFVTDLLTTVQQGAPFRVLEVTIDTAPSDSDDRWETDAENAETRRPTDS